MNPNAHETMNKFKMEAANEVGVNLNQGYNGDLTSRQADSIGGQMVKKMPMQTVDMTKVRHSVEVAYLSELRIQKNTGNIYGTNRYVPGIFLSGLITTARCHCFNVDVFCN